MLCQSRHWVSSLTSSAFPLVTSVVPAHWQAEVAPPNTIKVISEVGLHTDFIVHDTIVVNFIY